MPYCYWGSCVKFQGHTAKKIVDFDPNWAFPELELQLEFTDDYEMMDNAWSKIEEVPYCFSKSSVKFQSHMGQKIADFDPKWACPDCNLSLNSPMAFKWCTKLNVALNRCPIVFQRHPSKFKVTQDKQLPISTWIEHFRTVTWVQIHRWIWNDAKSSM